MKKYVIVISLMMLYSCISLGMPNKSYACSCMSPANPIKAVEQSKAVFSGKVLEIKPQLLDINGIFDQKLAVLFEVDQTWKGISQTQVIALNNYGEASCGYDFQVGQKYLVFASGYQYNKDALGTSICSLTKGFSVATAELNQIGQGIKPTEIVNLQKTMDHMGYTNKWAYVTAIFHRGIRYHLGGLMVVGGIVVLGMLIVVLRIRKR